MTEGEKEESSSEEGVEDFITVKDSGDTWRIVKSLGLDHCRALPLGMEEVLKALDETEDIFIYMWGRQGENTFFEKVKKLKRSRKAWSLQKERMESSLEIIEIPLANKVRHEVFGIVNERGAALSVIRKRDMAEEEVIPKEEEEQEEEMDSLFADKLGDPKRHQMNFWERQGRSPTLPSSRVGEWLKELCASKVRGQEQDTPLNPMVLRGMAKDTMQAHHRVIRWFTSQQTSCWKRSFLGWERSFMKGNCRQTSCKSDDEDKLFEGTTVNRQKATA